jgi:hypothetical protein
MEDPWLTMTGVGAWNALLYVSEQMKAEPLSADSLTFIQWASDIYEMVTAECRPKG